MGSIVLPFELDVVSRAYQNKSFPLGVIQANLTSEDFDVWLADKFIKSIYTDVWGSFDLYEKDLWSLGIGLTEEQSINLKPEVFNYNLIDVVELNKKMLSNGNYITGLYNEFYIPNSYIYNKKHDTHDYIIFGFDDNKQVFKSAGYRGDYVFFDIPYKSYSDAVTHMIKDEMYLKFYKVNTNFCPELNKKDIILKLSDYCESRGREGDHPAIDICGIGVWEELVNYITSSEGNYIDLRHSRSFTEHKQIMHRRMSILNKFGFLNNNVIETQYYERVVKPSIVVHNLFLKYNLKRDKKLLNRTAEVVTNINEAERDIINRLINELLK